MTATARSTEAVLAGLHKKNKVLAATLNETRLQNTALAAEINSMNGDILEFEKKHRELESEMNAKIKQSETLQKL